MKNEQKENEELTQQAHEPQILDEQNSYKQDWQRRQQRPRSRKRPNAIKRLFDHWYNRLLGVYNDKSFENQEEQYAANRTKRDFAFNTLGSVVFGIVFIDLFLCQCILFESLRVFLLFEESVSEVKVCLKGLVVFV